jgi:DNA-binding NarL/FixJ family response regulator
MENQRKIRVIIAEDHRIVREGLKALLGKNEKIEVIGEAGDGREAVELALKQSVDVVVMDILMPGLNGIDATKKILQKKPQTGIVLLSMSDDREHVESAIKAGVMGYVLKGEGIGELTKAIESVYRREAFFSPRVAKLLAERTKESICCDDELTGREREVLQLIAEGKTSGEIAQILGISTQTVEGHRINIMTKLDIHNTAGLVRYAIKKGIISVS